MEDEPINYILQQRLDEEDEMREGEMADPLVPSSPPPTSSAPARKRSKKATAGPNKKRKISQVFI
jgi:hypothetical protein